MAFTPPTLVNYYETSYTTTTATKSISNINWSPGDILVLLAGSEANNIITFSVSNPPAGMTLNSLPQNVPGATGTSSSFGRIGWQQTAGVNQTLSLDGPTLKWGWSLWVWRNSCGGGAKAEQHTGTQTVSMPAPATTNSAYVWIVLDFSASSNTGVTLTPVPTNIRQQIQSGTSYSVYVGDITNQANSGATSYGISGSAGAGPYSIIVVEIMSTPDGRSGSPADDRYRFRPSVLTGGTSTLGTWRSAWPDDACDNKRSDNKNDYFTQVN
jgi:hypothetical protein